MTELVTGVDTPTIETLQAELDKVRSALKTANAESADRRKKLETLEAAGKAGEVTVDSLKTELETERSAKASLEAALKQTRIKAAFIAKAAMLFDNPDDAFALADLSTAEVADDGTVSGFEKSLEALAKSGRLPTKSISRGDGLGTPRGTQRQQASSGVEPATPKIHL